MVRFRIRSLKRAAFIVSAIAALFNAALSILLSAPWFVVAASGIASYFLVYLSILFFVREYVVFRIKPLYELVLTKDLKSVRLSKELRKAVDDDLVDNIQNNLDQIVELSGSEIERLKIRESERSEFIASVAHEIRTPAFNISGYAETLLDGADEDAGTRRKFLERIVRSAERLQAIIEDVEKISDYESGGAIIYKEKFDLLALVNEVLDTFIVEFAKMDVSCLVNVAEFGKNRPIYVFADRIRISQALEKLIINSIQYNRRGGLTTVGLVDMFDKVMVEVTDEGIGIPPEDLPHVFDKLYRADKSRSRISGGAGLSLAAVKGMMDLHGESVNIRSREGEGTTVSFSLTKYSSVKAKE